jgi:hypothetical protein
VKQLGRFLRLERARKECEHEVPAPRRFETLEEAPVAGATTPHPSPGLERFTPEPPAPLELELPDAEQPFVRCLHCRADSVRHATVCRQCEARLDNEETRAFNLRLWAEMTAERNQEAEELQQRDEARRAVASDAGNQQGLAAEFAMREEARRALETRSLWTSGGWLGRSSANGAPATRLLVAILVGLPLLLTLSRRGSFVVGVVVALGLAALVTFASRRAR